MADFPAAIQGILATPPQRQSLHDDFDIGRRIVHMFTNAVDHGRPITPPPPLWQELEPPIYMKST
jgi:hypothetical protein